MAGVKAGRPHKAGTVLAREMYLRGLHVYNLSTVMQCSHRTVYDCLRGTRRIRPLEVAALCRLLHCSPQQIVDDRSYLRKWEEK